MTFQKLSKLFLYLLLTFLKKSTHYEITINNLFAADK